MLCRFRNAATIKALSRQGEFRRRESDMDDDRVKGSAQNLKGKAKEAAGKALGDEKLKAEGRGDQAAGKIRNAVGGLKDALREGERDRRR
jgi:uncharacterized protein YjbJ (UPF0337 family)